MIWVVWGCGVRFRGMVWAKAGWVLAGARGPQAVTEEAMCVAVADPNTLLSSLTRVT